MTRILPLFTLLVLATSSATANKPNILFIEADDLMPHFMNKLGGGFGHTPNLDRLGTEGVYLRKAVCQGPMCGPSRNCLLTNLYPHNLGFYRNGQLRNLPDDAWVFPPVLQKAGYQTAYVGKSHIKAKAGMKKLAKAEVLEAYGFDHVVCTGERYAMWKSLSQGKSIDDIPFIAHLKKRGRYEQFLRDNDGYGNLSTMEDDVDFLDGYAAQVAVDWIKEGRDAAKPFFMWFNFCLPHGPYDVPQRYYGLVTKLDIPKPVTDSFGHEVPAPLLADNKPADDATKIAKFRLGEAANVAFMDKMVGSLLLALEDKGELENTVVVFFSDHSIFLGNHGRIHKGTLFTDVLGSSLIVRYPKRFGKDQVVDHPVELHDLIPTAFDLAGVENPNEVAKNGYSLVPLLEGKTTNGRKFAFSEILGAQSATDGRYHYIVSEDYEMLYDHRNDPGEMKNIAAVKPEVAARFRDAVKQWLDSSGPVHPPKTY